MIRILLIVLVFTSVAWCQEKSGADLLRELEKKNGTDQETLQKRNWAAERRARSDAAIKALRQKDSEREEARSRASSKYRFERDQAAYEQWEADSKREAAYQERMRPIVAESQLRQQEAAYQSYLRSQEPSSVFIVPVTPGPVRSFKSGREAQRAGYYDGYYDSIYWGAYRSW